MRRITVLLLLALLPMRLWAVVWMPAQPGASVWAEQAAHDTHFAQPCHDAGVDASHDFEPSIAGHDGATCADCAACDLCHQSASLQFFAWPWAQAWPQGLPDWVTPGHPARHWPPPIEPPRS